jgi:hypothetical protein
MEIPPPVTAPEVFTSQRNIKIVIISYKEVFFFLTTLCVVHPFGHQKTLKYWNPLRVLTSSCFLLTKGGGISVTFRMKDIMGHQFNFVGL